MRNFYKKTSAVVLSVLLFGLIFGVGFFVGNSKTLLTNGVNAGEPLNLTTFWKTYSILENKFVETNGGEMITNEEKVYGAIKGLVDSYNDPYTTFLPPKQNEDFEETITGMFVGIGAEIGIRDDFLTIISPLKDSPAEKSGLRTGDKIISIDGKSAIDTSVDDAIDLIRGEMGTEVVLTVVREDSSEPVNIKIIRDTIIIPIIDTEIVDDVFVISLYNFSASASSEFRSALREFVRSDTNKLILDLRGNPGGFLDVSIDIASWFLPAGKIVAIEDFGENEDQKEFRSKGYNIFTDELQMVILIDQGSASASEILAGALNEYGVATLIGQKTFGKGSVQQLIDIDSSTALKVTIAKWLTPKGQSISKEGISPDIEIELDIESLKEGSDYDNQLLEAIKFLNN